MIDHYLHIRFAAGEGLQQQLRQWLVDAILSGIFPPHEALPSCRQLAEQLHISRNTVALVYESLLDKGYLVSRPRSGYYLHPAYHEVPPPHHAPAPSHPTAPDPQALRVQWSQRVRDSAAALHGALKPRDWEQFRYPFAYGQADSQLFPRRAWRDAERHMLSTKNLAYWACDSRDQDDPELIEQLRTRVLPKRGIWAQPRQILITMGSQNALYLTARLLTGPGVRVGMENPGYPDARNMFQLHHADIRLHDVDAQGLVVDASLQDCQYIYVTPSHQVPTGVTLSSARRQALWAMAQQHDQVLIEDDYDADLHLADDPQPALKSCDTQGRIIYMSSFSKSLAPGLRMGYIVADEELIDELRALRRLMYRHPPLNLQRQLAYFLAQGDYDAHLRNYRDTYRRKHAQLQSALQRHLDSCSYSTSLGAASFWLTAPDGVDTQRLTWAAARRSIMIEPGGSHFLGEHCPHRFFRLGLHAIALERIEPGVQLLADTLASV